MIKYRKKIQENTFKYKILMIATELAPFMGDSDYAESIVHLSCALADLGHDVRIVMPRYYNIDRKNMKKYPDPVSVYVGETEQWFTIYHTNLENSNVPVYLLEHEQFFGRNGLYGPAENVAYDDNAKRFTFLCSAAFKLCRTLQWIPNIMHSHDWAAGLVPVFLYTKEEGGEFTDTASVFTVHNINRQGIFDKKDFVHTSLAENDLYISRMEKDNKLNFLHAALAQADIITAASPGYAEEICTKESGADLDVLLKSRKADLMGILEGIDYRCWNPAKDQFLLPVNFSEKDVKNKSKAKKLLQKEMNLMQDLKIPVIVMQGSFIKRQRCFDFLFGDSNGKLYDICEKLKVQFIISGKLDPVYEETLARLQEVRSNLRVCQNADERRIHLLTAGADFILAPNEHEPFFKMVVQAMRYGTLPVVHKSGSIPDTVINYAGDNPQSTGFIFESMSPISIFDTVAMAVSLYYSNPKRIISMQKQAMMQRFDWEKSAKNYLNAYQAAIDRRRGRFERTWGNEIEDNDTLDD